MKKLLGIVVLGLLWCNTSFADTKYTDFAYKKYFINKKNKDERVYNILAEDWNKFLKTIEKDNSCDSMPVSLTVYTELVTCYYRVYEKHMRRNGINVNQEIIDAFYDHYSDVFSRVKSLQVNWLQETQRGGRPDVQGDVAVWVRHHDSSFEETINYSRKVWMKYAEMQSSTYENETNQKNTVQSGSGFFINNKGYFVTNYHVIAECNNKSKITFKEKDVDAKLIAKDESLDLALLSAKVKPKSYLYLSADLPEKIQTIYVAGYPFGKGLSDDLKITQGIISSLKGFGDNSNEIQIDAAINNNNSALTVFFCIVLYNFPLILYKLTVGKRAILT